MYVGFIYYSYNNRIVLYFRVPEVLSVPYKYKHVHGPLSTKTVFEWYIARADEIAQVYFTR